MSFDNKKGFCHCERCGRDWTSKEQSEGFTEPRSCAGCKSKRWNVPRVYAGKYISGTLAKRFKLTGRAAAKAKKKPRTVDEILDELPPQEKCAAIKHLVIWEMASMLEELGIK